MDEAQLELIAITVHKAVRAYLVSIGELPVPSWLDLEDKAAAIERVRKELETPSSTPRPRVRDRIFVAFVAYKSDALSKSVAPSMI